MTIDAWGPTYIRKTILTWEKGKPWWVKATVERGGKWYSDAKLIMIDGKRVESEKNK